MYLNELMLEVFLEFYLEQILTIFLETGVRVCAQNQELDYPSNTIYNEIHIVIELVYNTY